MIATLAHIVIETVIAAGLAAFLLWLAREGLRANDRSIDRHVERALSRPVARQYSAADDKAAVDRAIDQWTADR